MDNKDNLEKYIKEQVESIQFNEEDRMWENFSDNYDVSQDNHFFVYWMLAIVFCSSLLYLAYSNDVFEITQNISKNESPTENHKHQNVSIKEISTDNLTDEEKLTTLGNNGNKLEDSQLDSFSKNVEKRRSTSKNSNLKSSGSSRRKQVNRDNILTVQNGIYSKKYARRSTNQLRSTQSESGYSSTGQSMNNNENGKVLSNGIISNPTGNNSQNERENKQGFQSDTENDLLKEDTLNNANLVIPIASKEILQLEKIDSIPLTYYDTITPIALVIGERIDNRLKVEYRMVTSQYRTGYYALGLSYQLDKFTIGSGFQYSDGYSVSMDSKYRIISTSITDVTKYKDLHYMLETYLATSYDWKWKNIQLSLGSKAKYAFRNRFLTKEVIAIQHLGQFNTAGGNSVQSFEINDWSTLNRFRVDAFFEFTYCSYDGKLDVGFTFSRQLNRLIRDEGAAQANTNMPFQFGIHAKSPLFSM